MTFIQEQCLEECDHCVNLQMSQDESSNKQINAAHESSGDRRGYQRECSTKRAQSELHIAMVI